MSEPDTQNTPQETTRNAAPVTQAPGRQSQPVLPMTARAALDQLIALDRGAWYRPGKHR